MARTYTMDHPDDTWGVKALAWVLRDRILACLRQKDEAGAAELYAEFARIPIDGEDRVLAEKAEWLKNRVGDPVRPLLNQAQATEEAGRADEALTLLRDAVRRFPESDSARMGLGWALFKQLNALGKSEHPDRTTVRRLLREYGDLFRHPESSLLHSLILGAATRLVEVFPEYPRFFLWWNPAHFREEDARPYRPADADRDFPSLIEQVIKALHKSGKGIDDPALKGRCADFMGRWIDRFPAQEWFGYYYGLMLIGAGQMDRARDYLLPIIRQKQNEFWAWSALAQTYDRADENRLNCFCRAAAASLPDESFKVTVHAELAALWADRRCFPEARHELRTALEIRAAKGWSISPELAALRAADWAEGPAAPDGNVAQYAERGGRAAELLWGDVPWEEAVVLERIDARATANGERARPELLILGVKAGGQRVTDRMKRQLNATTRAASPGQPLRVRRATSGDRTLVVACEPRDGEAWDIWPERPGIVLSVRLEKMAVTVYLGKDEAVVFPFDRCAGAAGLEVGAWVMARTLWNERTARFRGLTVRRLDERPAVDWAREFLGPLRLGATGGFGFAGDVFIAPDKVAALGVAEGVSVGGMAILRKKPNRDERGWSAVTVDQLGAPVASADRPPDGAAFEAAESSVADEAADGGR